MRFLFLLILLAGVGLAGLYPWYNNNFTGAELGSWTVYDRAGGFRAVDVELEASDDPVRVLVDLTTRGPARFSGDVAVLTLTADTGGKTVLADTLTFSKSVQRDQSPQMLASVYRGEAGVISPVKDGTYRITVGRGDADGINYSRVDLVLRSGAAITDPRAQPVGFTLVAIGLIGIVLASRFGRGGRPENPNSQPPPPRWGRGAGN